MSASDDDLRALLGASCRDLADALASVPEPRWAEPSMCTGWSVANVVAHLTTPARYDEAAYTAELAADGFDFPAMSERLARRDGMLGVPTLLTALRSETLATFAMPTGGLVGSLSHVVIHGLDATWPLGLGRTCPDGAAAVVLEMLTAGPRTVFGVEIEGLELRAADLAWSGGAGGRLVVRPAGELVLALSGRAVPL